MQLSDRNAIKIRDASTMVYFIAHGSKYLSQDLGALHKISILTLPPINE